MVQGAANEAQMALLAAIVAAGRSQQFGTALQRLLGYVDAAQASLSDYDRGRFWHLKGVAAWRLDDALYSATRALNRGIALLQDIETLPAQAYLGRIFDTFRPDLAAPGLTARRAAGVRAGPGLQTRWQRPLRYCPKPWATSGACAWS